MMEVRKIIIIILIMTSKTWIKAKKNNGNEDTIFEISMPHY